MSTPRRIETVLQSLTAERVDEGTGRFRVNYAWRLYYQLSRFPHQRFTLLQDKATMRFRLLRWGKPDRMEDLNTYKHATDGAFAQLVGSLMTFGG